jgi:hypothetical protein
MEVRMRLFSFSILLLFLFGELGFLLTVPNNIPLISISQNASGSFSGGDGSISDPYQISNITQLQDINENLSAHYIMINNIDASETISWNNGKGFIPIGNATNYDPLNWNFQGEHFNGSLNGNGHKINGLYIDQLEYEYIGLFSSIGETGMVYNLSIENSTLKGLGEVGSITGWNNGKVDKCRVNNIDFIGKTGSASMGGLIGYNMGNLTNSIIESVTIQNNNISRGPVSSFGGAFGNNVGNVSLCQSIMILNLKNASGGGLGATNAGKIISSSFSGKITNGNIVGGLLRNNRGLIKNSSSIGTIMGKERVGGLVGRNDYNGLIEICSFKGNVSGQHQVGGLVGLNGLESNGIIRYSHVEGNISGRDPVGGIVGEMGSYGKNSIIENCHFKGRIDGYAGVGGIVGITDRDGEAKNLINNSSFDGIIDSYWYGGGIAGYLTGSIVNCSSIIDAICGYGFGGVVGNNYYGSVSSSNAVGVITTNSTNVGGVIGNNDNGILKDSFSRLTVRSSANNSDNIGGLVGENRGSVTRCYSISNVSGRNNIGGLIGASIRDSSISNSYTICSVSGETNIGGAIGMAVGSAINCYSNSFVNGTGNIGGFVGLTGNGDFSGCFFNNDTSRYSIYVGDRDISGITSMPIYDMTYKSTYENWDFNEIWDIANGYSLPFFKGEENHNISIISKEIRNLTEDRVESVFLEFHDPNPTDVRPTWAIKITDLEHVTLKNKAGELTFEPDNWDVGEHWIVMDIKDGRGSSDSVNLSFNVINTNDKPQVDTYNLPEATQDVEYHYQLEVFDPDLYHGALANDSINWSMETNATFLNLDPLTGNLTGLPTNADVGHWWILFSVSDGNGGYDERNLHLEVKNVNDKPHIICLKRGDQLFDIVDKKVEFLGENGAFEGREFNFEIWIYDPDREINVYDPHYFEVNTSVNRIDTSIVTGTTSYHPIQEDVGFMYLNITMRDSGDVEIDDYVNVVIQVSNTNDRPDNLEYINHAKTNTIEEGDYLNLSATADDIDLQYDPNEKLTFFWVSDIQGLLGIGPEISISNLSIGQHIINVTVYDNYGANRTFGIGIEVIQKTVINDTDPNGTDDDDDDDDIDEKEKEFQIFLVVIIVIVILLIVGIIIFVLMRKTYLEEE